MSNFLRHLVRRTLAPAATLQPRLASRFESGPAPTRFTEERIETGAAAPGAPTLSHPVAARALPVASPRAEVSRTAASSPPLATPSPAAPLPVIVSASTLLVVSPVLPAANPPPIAQRAEAVSFSTPPSTTAREIVSMPPASPSTLLIERVTERIRKRSPAPGTANSSSAAAIASPIIAPTITPATPAPIAAPISTSTPPTALPLAPPAAPTIRVTIGRVDIRAVHASHAAPARPPAPERRPLVSLETYLTQRDAK